MPPTVAASLWLISLLLLFRLDPSKDPEASLCLWVPVIWLFIAGSRLPSQWLGIQAVSLSQALEEGNSLDRTVELLLILLAFAIVLARSFNWVDFAARNLALTGYLFYGLISIVWSDFVFVSFKHWARDLGTYLVILVVISDDHPLRAINTIFRRLFYLLVPLSILLIKYYTRFGMWYDPWTGAPNYVGATTSKNMLGALCQVSGMFFFWDTLTRWSSLIERRRTWLFVNLSFCAMTLWLLHKAHSATSSVCLVLGCLVIAAAYSKLGQNHLTGLKTAILGCFVLYLVLGFGFGWNEQLAATLGRDPTMTGRTKIWSTLLGMHTNFLVGTGYESFWLGPRLDIVWDALGKINEAHNGYIEIYLNLGFIGLCLFVTFLISSFKNIVAEELASKGRLAVLALALWTALVFYMVTEAGFRGGLLAVAFLQVILTLPFTVVDTPQYQVVATEAVVDHESQILRQSI